MMGQASFQDLVASGKAKLKGNGAPVELLQTLLVQFTPDFEIMPGTKAPAPAQPPAHKPFAQPQPADSSGG
jgi:hypothetical protein